MNLTYKLILMFLIGQILSSCSPEKRLARILRNNPELIKTETIYKRDTTIVAGAKADTIFATTITRDTLVIKEKQLTIKYYNDGKTTYLKGVCDTIKIIKEIPVQVFTVQPPPVLTWWQRLKAGIWWLLVGVPIGALIVALLKFGR